MKESNNEEYRKEVRRRVKENIIGVFHEMLALTEDRGLKWRGTLTDLIELTHIAWVADNYLADDGHVMSFREMCDKMSAVLHCRQVSNPYSLYQRACQRKGRNSMPVLDRYVQLAIDYRLPNPMTLDVVFL